MPQSLSDQHRAWINPLQPDGLVVSPLALENAQLALPEGLAALQARFVSFLDDAAEPERLVSWTDFCGDFLGWPEKYILRGEAIPERCTLSLREYGEEIRPTFALANKGEKGEPFALGMVFDPGTDFEKVETRQGLWPASPLRKLERLLREADIPLGIITNHATLSILYAPRGENSGCLSFPLARMHEVWARSAVGALMLLLDRVRLWGDTDDHRLPALLKKSREAQAAVSVELASQVLGALYELLRGFQSANELSRGALLDDVVKSDGQSLYGGLLAVLMRLVFLLYAEDRGLMPATDIYEQSYSVHGLWKKMREDGRRYPDTMDQRYGAWSRLLALFRAVYAGCEHPAMRLPARSGHLFDPGRYPFLEGIGDIPALSDGCIARVLDYLLMLRGERLSYRSLDVEQIGSVYEAVMGFRFTTAHGLSIAIRPKKAHGAPPIINLTELAGKKAADRPKLFKEWTDRELTGKTAEAVKAAASDIELLSALESLQELRATPHPVPSGGWLLEPTDERRRSGSHYTPRSLTEPIVRKALEPIWAQAGEHPAPEEIEDLKICDPAMGSGAFLVEACRQIAERLVEAWHYHKCLPDIPADEDELLYAKRLVAQRCLYGVDRNSMAVDLAKLSLWLATLAKDHPFTFLDHALRHGDSLVGLSRRQIIAFHWDESAPPELTRSLIEEKIKEASRIRKRILESAESLSPETKAEQLKLADEALSYARLAGDLPLAAWFSADKDRARLTARNAAMNEYQSAVSDPALKSKLEARVKELKKGPKPLIPFHWEIEFPEVFGGEKPGFDVFVGNPPFAGKNTIADSNCRAYPEWLKAMHEDSHGNADLVAHFFRRAFSLLRADGTLGLIATNTIAQGDTRSTGLRYICQHGGTIYRARRRYKWPGEAAVVVSVVHIQKTPISVSSTTKELDGRMVEFISAYLFHQGGHESPKRLITNLNKSFQGSIILGMGFTFDDHDKKGVASSLADMNRLIEKDSHNAERIFPYLGGEEVNNSPTHAHHRHVINFAEMTEEEARKWPDLMEIVERKVKLGRLLDNRESYRSRWWRFAEYRNGLYNSLKKKKYIMAINCGATPHASFAIVNSHQVFANTIVVFPTSSLSFFSILQSHVHEIWARFFASSMKDDLRYTPSDCFETFPFPPEWEANAALEADGKEYYEFRAALMVKNDEGLTKTYNRFHDPDEMDADILRLRELHAVMDRAVLDAYGFADIGVKADFFLEYEEEDDEGSGRKRKKPWRYRWPDETRDDLLARLLELNAAQAAAQGEAPPPVEDEDAEGEE